MCKSSSLVVAVQDYYSGNTGSNLTNAELKANSPYLLRIYTVNWIKTSSKYSKYKHKYTMVKKVAILNPTPKQMN